MDINLIAFFGLALFVFLMGTLFLVPVLQVLLNGVILYLLTIRIYTEVKKYNRADLYLKCVIAASIVLLLIGNFLPLWTITSLGLVTFLFTHAVLTWQRRFH